MQGHVEIGPYVWGGPTYAWAPDSRTVAVHYVDRRGMRSVPFPDYLGEETVPNTVRRGYPGDPNEVRTVGLLRVESGELTLLDLPDPTSTRALRPPCTSRSVRSRPIRLRCARRPGPRRARSGRHNGRGRRCA